MADTDGPPRPPHRVYLEDETADPFELTREQQHIGWWADEAPAVWEPDGGLQRCVGQPASRPYYDPRCEHQAHPDSPYQLCEWCTWLEGWCAHCLAGRGIYEPARVEGFYRECATCWRWLHRNRSKFPGTIEGDRELLAALGVVIEKRRARARAKADPKPSSRRHR